MCQDIALLSIYGQTDVIDMWFGNWITWNSEAGACYIYDEAECDTLSGDSEGDYSFQLCGEGYAPSKYQSGDKPDGGCDQGDLDDAGVRAIGTSSASSSSYHHMYLPACLRLGILCFIRYDDDDPCRCDGC